MKEFYLFKIIFSFVVFIICSSCAITNGSNVEKFEKYNLDWTAIKVLVETEERTHWECSWDDFLKDVKHIEQYSRSALIKYAKYENVKIDEDSELYVIDFKTDCKRKLSDYFPMAYVLKEKDNYKLIKIDRTSE